MKKIPTCNSLGIVAHSVLAIDLFTVLTYRGASVLPRSAVINAGPEIESSLCLAAFAAELLPTSQCAKI